MADVFFALSPADRRDPLDVVAAAMEAGFAARRRRTHVEDRVLHDVDHAANLMSVSSTTRQVLLDDNPSPVGDPRLLL